MVDTIAGHVRTPPSQGQWGPLVQFELEWFAVRMTNSEEAAQTPAEKAALSFRQDCPSPERETIVEMQNLARNLKVHTTAVDVLRMVCQETPENATTMCQQVYCGGVAPSPPQGMR